MKNFRIIFLFVALMATAMFITSCSSNTGSDATKTEKQGKEYTSAYVCPMHCEGSGSDQPGKCPKCGMDYVKNENHGHEGHNH